MTASELHGTASVAWEIIGTPAGTVTRGGTVLSIVTELDAVTSRVLIKTPLDGQATVWR